MFIEGSATTAPNQDPTLVHLAANDGSNQIDTAADIRKQLEGGGFLEDDLTHDELQSIVQGVATMDARQANEVIGQLSDAELATISGEMTSGGLGQFNGLNLAQRGAFLGDLSSRLDGQQFERVARAYGNPAEVADAVAQRGSNDAKLAFIRAHAGAVSNPAPFGINGPAGGIATVLASMDADGLRRALVGMPDAGQPPVLSAEQLRDVMQPTVNSGGRVPTTTVNASRLEKIVDVATRNGSTDLKALVFQTAAGGLADVQQTPGAGTAPRSIGDGMAALLRSDTNGIVDRLENADPGGTALKTFTRQQVSDGNTDGLRDMLASLRNGPTGDAAAHLADEKHAHNLGYAIGAAGAGVEDLKKSAADNAEVLGGLLGSVAGEVPIAGSALSFVSSQAAKAAVGNVEEGTTGLTEALYGATVDGLPEAYQGEIDTAMSRVLDLQQIGR